MEIKNRLLLINVRQFGYHTDSSKIAGILADQGWTVTYICFDQKLPRLDTGSVTVVYVPRRSRLKAHIDLYKSILANSEYNDVIHVVYFRFCFGLALINKPSLLDIRTLSVTKNILLRVMLDLQLRVECLFFRKIIAISNGVAKKLWSKRKIKVIGLAADPLSFEKKTYDNIKLLYVGTLENRDIEKTVEGIGLFLRANPMLKPNLEYNIIGSGGEIDLAKIKHEIQRHGLQKNVHMLGYIPQLLLPKYFALSNIGISFVPNRSYYQHQPPTKTFEYLKSGLFTIATDTESNLEIIRDGNGILINDTPQDFAHALEHLFESKHLIDDFAIRDSVAHFNWKNIAEEFKNSYG